jgi:hypothetical protein
MVQHHAQLEFRISSSRPRAAMRRNFLGSISSRPVAGQPEEQSPQVRHRFRFPPSGKSPMTWSLKVLFFLPLILIIWDDIISSIKLKIDD